VVPNGPNEKRTAFTNSVTGTHERERGGVGRKFDSAKFQPKIVEPVVSKYWSAGSEMMCINLNWLESARNKRESAAAVDARRNERHFRIVINKRESLRNGNFPFLREGGNSVSGYGGKLPKTKTTKKKKMRDPEIALLKQPTTMTASHLTN
jgi:hypothetical protein